MFEPDAGLVDFLKVFFTVLSLAGIYYVTNLILNRQSKGKTDWGIIRSMILFSIMLVGVIVVILSLPWTGESRGQITNLIGIVISAVLALRTRRFYSSQ